MVIHNRWRLGDIALTSCNGSAVSQLFFKEATVMNAVDDSTDANSPDQD